MANFVCPKRLILCFRRFIRGLPHTQKTVTQDAEVPAEVAQVKESGQVIVVPTLTPAVEELLSSNTIKAKHHPGLRNHKLVTLPDELQVAAFSLMGKYKQEEIRSASKDFAQLLKSRLPPVETAELRVKAADIEQHLRSKTDIDSKNPTPEELDFYEETIKKKLYSQLRRAVYHWKPIQYDAYNCFLYLYSRFPAEYAVLTKVFAEIRARDEHFSPEYLLDIGSGLCSVLWASRPVWQDAVRVALCIDTSPDIQKIARLLMQGGKPNGKSAFEGVFFKAVVPHGDENKYDLVTCAYSLLDMESSESRMKLYQSMLSKTRKYIVLVEHATVGGFKLITEARDFYAQLGEARIVAPCPHELACPRLVSRELSPVCSFSANYVELRLITQKQQITSEEYSYLIVEKVSDKNTVSNDDRYPRVLHSAPRPRHVHLHSCCPDGAIRQIVITPNKNGKHLYKCASYCKAGDVLPCTMQPKKSDESKPEE